MASENHCKIRNDKGVIAEMTSKESEANMRNRLQDMDSATGIEACWVRMYK
jgi:hypothetical protein